MVNSVNQNVDELLLIEFRGRMNQRGGMLRIKTRPFSTLRSLLRRSSDRRDFPRR